MTELKTTDEVLLSATTLLQIKQKTSFYAQILRGECSEMILSPTLACGIADEFHANS